MKKHAGFLLISFLLFLIYSCANNNRNNANELPNILFLFADDQSYLGVNILGNDEVISPNLDGLAESGVTFTHAYNMGAWHGAVCVASRAMLNSGRMIWGARTLADKGYPDYKSQALFWSQLMEERGYDTYMTGKWHVNINADSIFQNTGHIRGGMPGTVPESYNRPLSADDTTWLPWDTKWGGFWEGGKHWSEVVADEAIGFIDISSVSDNPFFMYIAFNAPHDPRQSPKEFVDMYPLDEVSLPASFIEEYPYKEEMGCPPALRDEKLAPFPRTPYSVKVHRQEYYAIISHMDVQVGRIIDYLKESGLDKNTYIIFSADHGLGCGNHGLLGKQNMYDHSMRVPLIIAGPDIPANERRDMQVYLQDLMATTLDLAGIQKPDYVDFNSLVPMIDNKSSKSPYSDIYGAYRNLQRMIRSEKYKLIYYTEAAVYRLYDIEEDPQELNDLANDPDKFELIKELSRRFMVQQKFVNDTLNMSKYFPVLF